MTDHPLLSKITSAAELQDYSVADLKKLAGEIRDALCNLLNHRTAHFASNLGVVELCLALHSVFDFRRDRLIWDTGHQIYPHKLVTGRYHQFATIRTKGGLMGYPNPAESDYDLFMTGHAGCSVSSVMGLRSGDLLQDEADRRAVCVIGDGAFPSGIVHEAMNNAGGMNADLLVILNDNKMSICPRVGGLASYLDRLRTTRLYTGFKNELVKVLNKVPLLGDPVERFLAQIKESVKAGFHGGMLFEELGFRYLGPIDGHNINVLRKYLKMVKDLKGPILLHVVTEKGHGHEPAEQDPVFFHTPPAFAAAASKSDRAFTHFAQAAAFDEMGKDESVVALTAAMCQGNKLEAVREKFPERFFDTGICESHTIAFAAGQAKSGLRPLVAIYSTFLQRAYDQIFQEVALQNLPVTFLLDRAGLAGPDGPTHHGIYDLSYMRVFPNMVVMAPGDGSEVAGMMSLALKHQGPVAIRYPKAGTDRLERPQTPIEMGRAEVIHWGTDGLILSCGALLNECLAARDKLLEEGLNVGVVNARFVKPIDRELVRRAIQECPFVVTVEEAALAGGFGAAVLEVAEGLDSSNLQRLGIPDIYVNHGDRQELLRDLGLDATGIAKTCREMAGLSEVSAAS